MAFDAHANFAYTSVATPPSPPTSGTSLTVAAGAGALFPAAPFNCTVWPANPPGGLSFPTTTTAEIIRVTAVVGDVLTIVRAQESTSARTILAGDQIGNTVTVKVLTDIQNAIPSVPTGANPTASVGLTVALGSATTFMRSDAAPPLSQTIVPTWTGLHTFSNGLTISGGNFTQSGGTFSLTGNAASSITTAAGALTISGFTGINLQLNGSTLVDIGVTSASALTLAANISLSGAAGTGGLSLGSMTGASAMPTGNFTWSGASGKTLVFASSGNGTVNISAGGATASLFLDSGANVFLGSTNAQNVQIGNSTNCSFISFTVTSGGTIGGAANGQTIQNVAGVASGIPVDLTVCGRATLTSGIPVTASDVTGALGGYFTPYEGNVVVLYDGTIPRPVTFSEIAWLITDSSQTGGTLTGSTITGLTDTSKLFVGMKLTNSTGTGTLGASPTIATIASATSITISQGAGNVNGTLTNLTFKMPANSNLDWYGVFSSGSMVLRPGTLWISQTAEADTVALVNGRWMNTSVVRSGQSNTIAANQGLRLFTVATNATDGQTDDAGGSGATPGSRLLLNWYKPRPRSIQCCPGYVNDNATTSYSATFTSWVAANGGTNATFKFLSSAEYAANLTLSAHGLATNISFLPGAGIGIDSTTSPAVSNFIFANTTDSAPTSCTYSGILSLGVHSITLCLCSLNGSSSVTWYADANRNGATADTMITCIQGTVWT